MTLYKILRYCFICPILSGCIFANGPLEYATQDQANQLNYLPIFIPYLLGGHGSAVPITNELSLTVKHVARFDYSDVVAYHPECDIAIIRKNNTDKDKATLGLITSNNKLSTIGWGMLGKVIQGKGQYFADATFATNANFKVCPASITDAAVKSGMSGGGVFNRDHELVGIIAGYVGSDFRFLNGKQLGNQRTSLFVSVNYFKSWLYQQLSDFYEKPIEEIALKHNFNSKQHLQKSASY